LCLWIKSNIGSQQKKIRRKALRMARVARHEHPNSRARFMRSGR